MTADPVEVSTGFDLGETDRLLSTTRAVRRRLDLARPVPRDVVMDCVRLAMQAPTATNNQNWRWLLVDDPGKRRELGNLYRRMADLYLRDYPGPDNTAQTKRVLSSAIYLSEIIGDVPLLAVPCIVGTLGANPPTILAASFYGSIYPAVWSFQLALHSRGLGSCLTTLHLASEAEARVLLGIPGEVTQAALLPVAYTTGSAFRPAHRPAPETITSWNTWGT
jgi:nitroreductase